MEVLADLSRGMVRDSPRSSIPDAACYDARDFLLHEPGVARKRGGTEWLRNEALAGSYLAAIAYAEFAAGSQVLAIDNAGNAAQVASGAVTGRGTVPAVPVAHPVLRVDKLVIPIGNGTTGPYKYLGNANVAALGGSPPAGKYAALYKTRVVLGGATATPNRIYFSQTPNIEDAWDTANSWIDCDYAITGLAALQNALLIFSEGHAERIIGTTPPPGSDMDKALVGSVGCTDARSIVVSENNALFANPRGVYLTNGTGFASLTTEGLIESYWQSLFAGYDRSTWTIAAGIYRSFYMVWVLNASGALVDALICNVPRRAWGRLTNLRFTMLATAVGVQDELYGADRASAKVQRLSPIFTPTVDNERDADATAVTPLLETRMIGSGTGLKHFGRARLTYNMVEATIGDNPSLVVSAATGIEAPSFSQVAVLTENTNVLRRPPISLAKIAQGITLRFAQSGASAQTELYSLEVEERALPLVHVGPAA